MSATTAPLLSSPTQAALSAHGTALLRVTQGLFFVAHGGIKLFVFTPAGTAGYFASLGLPAGLAYATIALELLGGLALLVGYRTRAVALALVPVMLGALFAGHAAKGFLFSAPGGGWEYPAFWTVALLAQAALGSGALALDKRR
jgi:putative oxidoreductase